MSIIAETKLMLRKAALYFATAGFLAGAIPGVSAQTALPAAPPSISLSANGSINAQAFQGSALILHASLYHPNLYSRKTLVTPLLINSQNGSWANTVQLLVSDASGAVQNWPVQLIAPTGSLLLDHTSAGALTWVLAPSATSNIAPGTYTAIAMLNTTASAGSTGWSGTTNSYGVSIQIAAAPSQPTSDQQEDQAVLLAIYDHLLGDTEQSITDLDDFLGGNPAAVRALTVKGQYLEELGQLDTALTAYGDAIASFYAANPGSDTEVPARLLATQGRVRSTLLSQSNTRGTPQIQILLAGQGTQSAGVNFVDLQITNTGTDVAQNVSINHFTLQVLDGSGQALFNNVLSPHLPISTNFLDIHASSTVRIFLNTQGTVSNVSLTEAGMAADIFGTPAPFSQTQTISLNSSGGGDTSGPLTITAPTVTQIYGQATPAINNVTYVGFVNGDGPGSLTGSLNCTTTAKQSNPVGTYPITCSGLTSPNYTITFVPGILAITPALLKITANNAVRQFTQPNPLFTASFSAFANGDTISALIGALSCSTSAMSTSSVAGSPYPINCSGVSSPNYAITFVPGSLVITKATPTITWSNPVDLGLGVPLSSAQLNAVSNVPGNFVYNPPAGTVLPVGNAQQLSVTFTPTDTADYVSTSASVFINVKSVVGDLNGDGVVNCDDLAIIKASFGKKTGQSGFDVRADVNHDEVVNVLDLAFVARQLPAGTSCK